MISNFILIYKILLYVYIRFACMSGHMCRGQRIMSWALFFTFTFMWVQGPELSSAGLQDKGLYLLNLFTSTKTSFKM